MKEGRVETGSQVDEQKKKKERNKGGEEKGGDGEM